MPNFVFPWKPNAGGEPLPKAEARHERRLEAVGCTPLFGAGFGTAFRPRWTRYLSCPLWLLRRLEEADHLMLEYAMAALQVHHVPRIGDDHVPLIRVR